MLCARKSRSRWWTAFASRWQPHAAVHCRRAHSAKPAITRSHLGEAHSLLGISRAGVEQQLGGELHAANCYRQKKLDPRRQLTGRTEDRSDSLDRGKL